MKIKPGIYKHSKTGKMHRVIGMAVHSETLEPMVVYESLYDNSISKMWVRPACMFEEIVMIEGKRVPRFVFVSDK